VILITVTTYRFVSTCLYQ